MTSIVLRILLIGLVSTSIYSCREDQSYYCYLVEEEPPYPPDTLQTYDEAFWFYKRRSKPEDECKVDRADLILANQYNPNYSCNCYCGWEDD